jgi:adenosylhomocysteine nucleosidase
LVAILVLTAVEIEARALARALSLPPLKSFSFPVFGDSRFRLAPVGLAASSLATRLPRLLEGLGHPLVISAGVCGGLDPEIRCGSLVLPETVIGGLGERFRTSVAHHRHHVAALSERGMRFATGALVTVPEPVATPEAKATLRKTTGAVAVDMESALILRDAAAAGCPGLVLRGISDDAADSLPHELMGLVTAEGRVLKARAARAVLMHPTIVPKTIQLQRATRRALATVAEALQWSVEYRVAVEHEGN